MGLFGYKEETILKLARNIWHEHTFFFYTKWVDVKTNISGLLHVWKIDVLSLMISQFYFVISDKAFRNIIQVTRKR